MKRPTLIFGFIACCLVVATAFVFADGRAVGNIEAVRIRRDGKVVAEVRLTRGVTMTTVVQPEREKPVSDTVGVITNAKVRISFLGGDYIEIKAADAEIVREKQ